MEWVQIFAIIFSVFGLFLWARSEANSDRRETQNILREDRKDFIQMNKSIETIVKSIQDEMKDFHYRLLEIEKARK